MLVDLPVSCNLPVQPSLLEAPISAEIPDWSREFKTFFSWCPSRSLLASIRLYQKHLGSANICSPIIMKIAVLRHRFWSVITSSDIQLNCQIAGGLLLPHPNGVVIYPQARIGPNCLIFQQVTIGARSGSNGAPVIGGHVDIGAGAKILGGITIGNHAIIGANAVVLKSIPEGKTAVGIPAAIVEQKVIDDKVAA